MSRRAKPCLLSLAFCAAFGSFLRQLARAAAGCSANFAALDPISLSLFFRTRPPVARPQSAPPVTSKGTPALTPRLHCVTVASLH